MNTTLEVKLLAENVLQIKALPVENTVNFWIYTVWLIQTGDSKVIQRALRFQGQPESSRKGEKLWPVSWI